MIHTLLPGAVSLAVLAGLAGCGDEDKGSAKGGEKIAVNATDSECQVAKTDLTAGTYTFTVTNKGTKETEFYVYAKGDKIKAEVEHIGSGATREVNVELAAGDYQAACKPGMKGGGIRVPLTVSGQAKALADDPLLSAAVTKYAGYVAGEADALLVDTTAFAAAVKAGDVAQARALYPGARTHWERIEPVAESFGDLDAAIDARENDVPAGAEWTGFHRLEKDLWVGTVGADGPVVDRLLADVGKVVDEAHKVKLAPLDMANGSKELLDEVATTKMTGEEDRYSHTDLWDFASNVEGAKAAVTSLREAIGARDAALLASLDAKFAAMDTALAKHRVGQGWRPFNELSAVDRKDLADAVNGLAEPVSRVGAVVAKKAVVTKK
jgi:iron uptake system component EfeO